MRCACVDIGSNTTRTLVADVDAEGLREVVCEKAYSFLGRRLPRSPTLSEDALDTVAATVADQVAVARALGAERIRVVATAALRAAANADALRAVVGAHAHLEVDVLEGAEEARLAFTGATRALATTRRVAVVDVGGGSTEVAVGTVAAGVEWSVSVPVGSSTLADGGAALGPGAREALAGLRPPPVDLALAVGGSATSTGRLVGPRIDAESARAAVRLLRTDPAHGLDPERVRLMPAGLALLAAVATVLGRPLDIGRGGLREGVCLELAFTAAG